MTLADGNARAKPEIAADILNLIFIDTMVTWALASYFESHGHPFIRDFFYFVMFSSDCALLLVKFNSVIASPRLLAGAWVAFSIALAALMIQEAGLPMPNLFATKLRFVLPIALTVAAFYSWHRAFHHTLSANTQATAAQTSSETVAQSPPLAPSSVPPPGSQTSIAASNFLTPANESDSAMVEGILAVQKPEGNEELRANLVAPHTLKVFFGSCLGWTSKDRQNILTISGVDVLTIVRSPAGIAIDAKLFAENGEIVAEIEGNEFFINRDNCFRFKKPDPHTLIVIDKKAQTVLYIRHMNPSTVRLWGTFHGSDDRSVTIEENGTVHVRFNGKKGEIRSCVFEGGTKGMIAVGRGPNEVITLPDEPAPLSEPTTAPATQPAPISAPATQPSATTVPSPREREDFEKAENITQLIDIIHAHQRWLYACLNVDDKPHARSEVYAGYAADAAHRLGVTVPMPYPESGTLLSNDIKWYSALEASARKLHREGLRPAISKANPGRSFVALSTVDDWPVGRVFTEYEFRKKRPNLPPEAKTPTEIDDYYEELYERLLRLKCIQPVPTSPA